MDPTAVSYEILALSDAMTATGQSRIWIGSIVVDCSDLPRMIAFWQEALHYVPRDPPEPDGVVLKDPEDRGPNLSLNLTPEGPLDDYRTHLDLYSSAPEKEVERLLRLGATLKKPAEEGHDFATLADPDGNLFDVIDKKGWSFGQHS
ncbi:MAG: VOC family protein [Thermoplasmata archaeon]